MHKSALHTPGSLHFYPEVGMFAAERHNQRIWVRGLCTMCAFQTMAEVNALCFVASNARLRTACSRACRLHSSLRISERCARLRVVVP